MTFRTLAAALALSATLATPAWAQSKKWSVSFDLGADVALSGNVHDAGTGTVLGLPTTVEARTYGDIYGSPFTWAAGLGYRVTPNMEIRGRFFRTAGASETVQVGNVATLPLFADFDDYVAMGFDGGVRAFLGSADAKVQPFVGASAGMLMTDEINSTFSVPAASVVLSNVPMLGESTVFTFAASAGLFIPMGQSFALQGGVDFRWHDNLDPVDGLAGTGLEPINDKTSRWSMPVTIGVVIRF
jgi:hypothetical protein